MLGELGVGLLLGHEGADGLGGVLEAGVVGVDLDLGDHGGDVPTLEVAVHGHAEGLLQVVADVALAHGAALGEVDLGELLGVDLVGGGEGVLDHADLRAVAVGDDDLVAHADDLEQGRRGGADLCDLLFRGVAKGVSAEGDDDAVGILDSGHWSLLTVPLASQQRARRGTRLPYILSVWVASEVDQYKWV